MARIRSIKPELRTDLTVAAWPIPVRYAWVLLWGYLDDYGRGRDDPRLLKADLFPLDDAITAKKLAGWVATMAADGCVCRYEVDGDHYLHALHWGRHQRPSHPLPSRIPPCPTHEIAEDCGKLPEDVAQTSEKRSPEQVVVAGSREQVEGAGSRLESVTVTRRPVETVDNRLAAS